MLTLDNRTLIINCEICGNDLESGYLYSGQSIDWFFDDDSFVKKTLAMGQRISPDAFLSSGKAKGLYCPTCKTIILQNIEMKTKAKANKPDAGDDK